LLIGVRLDIEGTIFPSTQNPINRHLTKNQ
jgi:hypothetical protein